MLKMTDYVFKIYSPSGKTVLTWHFGDDRFIESFHVEGCKIIFHYDIAIELFKFSSTERARAVLHQLIARYRNGQCFLLPDDTKFY